METYGRAGGETTAKPDLPPLPYRKPLRTWAGHGTGARCSGCGETIKAQDIEYEIELPARGAEQRPIRFQPGNDPGSLRFHFACYRSWSGR